jgi:energy-coupling factor transporter ATP-binding protein EcfA2
MGVAESFRIRLAEVQRQAREARKDPSRWPFREAAAVLSRFVPATLQPIDATDPAQSGWDDFLLDSEPASKEESSEWWQLRDDVRRETFRRMGTRERMRQALNANLQRSDDELQRALTTTINGKSLRPLSEMSREEVSALVAIRDWLGGILDGLPTEQALRRALVIAEVLTPMQRLAGGDRFVGRQGELATLRQYVGVVAKEGLSKRVWGFVRDTYYDLTSRPPLLITGPGGAGKSTLVARFILDHSENFESPDALPFVYLDLDRAALDPALPLSLVAEAALQLVIQWPSLEKQLLAIVDHIRPFIRAEASIFEGTRALSGQSSVMRLFGQVLAQGSGQRPVLFVIDTFEEAQYLGFDVVQSLGRLLVELQKDAPMLRIVLVGRADWGTQTSIIPTTELRLGDLSKDEARDLLRRNIAGIAAQDPEIIDQMVDLVGRNPLSLKLASTVVSEQGVKDLKSVETRSWLLLRVKAETVQARLYGRIIAHIHDEDVRKLVNPGVVVRRLTKEVIRDVLAEPCGISLADPARAGELMTLLANEVALIVPADDGSLRHRPELRRLILKDLTEDARAATVREIHDRAVTFYAAQPPDPISRAEETYHRLMRGDEPSSLDSRWVEGAQKYLQTAIEEVPPAARIWLSFRLGVTPDRALLAQAELEGWESITARSVQRLLNAGNAGAALEMLHKRSDRTGTSPLFHLESEALRLLGRWKAAREAAEQGIAASAKAGAPAVQRDLLMQLALVEETAGDAAAALKQNRAAMSVPGDCLEPIEKLRLTIAEIRLLRKIGAECDKDRRAAIDRALTLLTPDVQDDLNQRPAFLREVVAELGIVKSDLLNQSLEVLGLESVAKTDTDRIAHALTIWDKKLSIGGGVSEIAQRAGLTDKLSSNSWLIFVSQAGSRELSTNIMNWRAEMQPDRDVDKALVDFYRSGVEAALLPRRSDVR